MWYFVFTVGSTGTNEPVEKAICRAERHIFLDEWRKHPTQLGTLAPVTVRFADAVSALIPSPDCAKIVEIGAGTGRITRALLRAGVNPKNLVAVELSSRLCDFLRQCWNHDSSESPTIVEGNAVDLPNIIPCGFVGHTTTVVSAIPFRYIGPNVRSQIIKAAGKILAPGGSMLHVTYHPRCPMPSMDEWGSQKRLAMWWNVPPAFVFEFKPTGIS